MNISNTAVKKLLAQVGIVEHAGSSELAPGITADTFESEYARLYITNCVLSDSIDWSDVVRRVDRKILQDVRSTELAGGGVIDAHVCFVVIDDKYPLSWAQQNEQLVRHVSRKYWINSSNLQDELENRLTLLPVTSAPPLSSAQIDLSREDISWLDHLVLDGATGTFTRFISMLETSK